MRVKSIAEATAHALGAVPVLRFIHRSRARILMYHRFPGSPADVRATLTAQCEHLRRYYNSVSLTELVTAIQENRPISPRTLAITVDDGYADFAHAFPVFQSFGIKVTLYVVSGFASGELWLWPDRVQFLIDNTALSSLTVPLPDGAITSVDTRTTESRRRAFEAICQSLILADDAGRIHTLDALPRIFKTQLPAGTPENFAPLSWDQLRAMAAQGLDIGCHTQTHPIVSKLRDKARLNNEIAGAKRCLEKMIGRPVHNFCYPNGRFADFNDASISAIIAAGFRSAVTTETGLAGQDSDLFRLPRIGVEPGLPQRYFERVVAGYRA